MSGQTATSTSPNGSATTNSDHQIGLLSQRGGGGSFDWLNANGSSVMADAGQVRLRNTALLRRTAVAEQIPPPNASARSMPGFHEIDLMHHRLARGGPKEDCMLAWQRLGNVVSRISRGHGGILAISWPILLLIVTLSSLLLQAPLAAAD